MLQKRDVSEGEVATTFLGRRDASGLSYGHLRRACGQSRSNVLVLIRQWRSSGSCQVLLVFLHLLHVQGNLGGLEGGRFYKRQVGLVKKFPCQPEERLLKIVVALGRNVVVLEILFAMKCNRLGFNLAIFDVDLVTNEDDGNIFADSHQIPMPVGHVLVRDTRSYVEHDDSTLTLNVVAIAQTPKFLLACCIPNIEANRAIVGVEAQRMYLNAQSGNIFLFKFTCEMALNEGRLSNTTVSDQNQLKGGYLLLWLLHIVVYSSCRQKESPILRHFCQEQLQF